MRHCLGLVLIFLVLLVPSISGAIEKSQVTTEWDSSDASEFLGIYTPFTKWVNKVPWFYSHSSAPEGISEDDVILEIQIAMEILEGLADVEFEYRSSHAKGIELNDGVVGIGWKGLSDGFLGNARLTRSINFDDYLEHGYWPAVDGRIYFTNLEDMPSQRTILHELMHILGIGHSENPFSIMHYPNYGYSRLLADDEKILHSLYGYPDIYRPISPNPDSLDILSRSGVRFVQSNIGFEVGPFDSEEDRIEIDIVGEELEPDNWVWVNMEWKSSNNTIDPDELISLHVTMPNGDPFFFWETRIAFENGVWNPRIGRVKQFGYYPGDWKVTFVLSGEVMYQLTMPVEHITSGINKTPDVALNAQVDKSGNYFLELLANDPEGDEINYKWHMPDNTFADPLDDSSLEVTVATAPKTVYATVFDDVDRNLPGTPEGSRHGEGFGWVERIILMPPSGLSGATYFAEQGLLSIPRISLGGIDYSLIFERIESQEIEFKLVQINSYSVSEADDTATFNDIDGVIHIPALTVLENEIESSHFDIQFEYVSNSNPVRITLQ